ncbi:MAG TPA: MFS transporter [Chloroflexota bacterium]|nr:MFS transporter [Chloroflexota bacterium]
MLKIRGAARITSWGAVPMLLVSQGLINIGLGTFSVLYNLYLAAIGQSLAFIGTFNALSILALGLSAVPIGAGARLLGHRQALGMGTLLLVAVQVVLALTTTQALLLTAGVVWGVAQALCVVPVAPLLSESVPRTQRAMVFGWLYAAWALATAIGSILGGVLPGLLAALFAAGPATGIAAYRGALLITTVITVLGWPLLLLPLAARPEVAAESQIEGPVGHGWALRTVRRTITAVVLTIGLYSFAGGLVAPFFNVYFAQNLHLATSLIGVLFALAAFLSVPGSLLGPRLSRRLGSIRAVVLVRLAVFPCLLGLALGNLVPLLAMSGFLLRFALIYISGALDNHFTLSSVPARTRPLAAGVRTGTYNLCWALGAWGAGDLIGRVGYPAMFLTSAVLTVLASLLFLGLFGMPVRKRD